MYPGVTRSSSQTAFLFSPLLDRETLSIGRVTPIGYLTNTCLKSIRKEVEKVLLGYNQIFNREELMRSITEYLIQNGRSVCVKIMKPRIPEYEAESVAILSQSQRYFCP